MKKRLVFRKKNLEFLFEKTPKSSQFDAEWNQISKIFENVRNLRSFWKKINWFFEKILEFFKIDKSSKFALQGHWKCKNSQNVQKLILLIEKKMCFSERICDFFWKMVKGSNFTVECNWISKKSQDVPNLVSSWKNKLVSRMKTLRILRTANGSKFAVECNWINKISQNVQKI